MGQSACCSKLMTWAQSSRVHRALQQQQTLNPARSHMHLSRAHTQTHMHMHTHMYAHTNTYAHTCTCTHMYEHMCTYTCVHHKHMHTCRNTHVRTRVHAHVCTHTNTHAHMQKHTHHTHLTHTYTQNTHRNRPKWLKYLESLRSISEASGEAGSRNSDSGRICYLGSDSLCWLRFQTDFLHMVSRWSLLAPEPARTVRGKTFFSLDILTSLIYLRDGMCLLAYCPYVS